MSGIANIGVNNGLGIASSSSFWSRQLVTLRSGNNWYKREINRNLGVFRLYYSADAGGTWDELLTLDLIEDSVVIDLTHVYRHRIVGTSYHVDRKITVTGYAGIENTDWETIYST
jgi:hypothetical protein